MNDTSHCNYDAMRDKFLGCMLGLALGDALGAPFEGAGVADAGQVWAAAKHSSHLRYTDDTHMAIGSAESLIACRGFDGRHMTERFINNFDHEPWRGYGPGPPRIFIKIKEGASWDRAAEDIYPGGSFGNGSAMRVAPIGLFFYRNLEKLKEVARLQSRITHTHPLGQEGASLQALAVALAAGTTMSACEILTQLKGHATEKTYRRKLEDIEALLDTSPSREVAIRLGNGVEAFNSVPTAIFCFLRHPDSFEDAVLEAVSLGGDADTIACMAGAISGARMGLAAIPGEWISKLENKDYLEKLGLDLWAAAK